jgi:uncharacterized protein YukE
MSDRVLSTQAALDAARQLQQVINGPLADQIELLNRQGQVLCDPNLWDGNQARLFRQEWPQHLQNLRRTQESLNQLRATVERAIQNIMLAGGD